MIRDAGPETVNAFANHADIRPHIGGEGPIDLTIAFTEPNRFLFGAHGGFSFVWAAPETYEIHVMLTPRGRGAWGIKALKLALRIMRRRGANHIFGRVHPDRPEVAAFGVRCGFKNTNETHTLDIGDGPVPWRIYNWRA